LDGIWDLDQSISESLDPVLVIQGANWLERRVAVRLDITQTIRVIPDGYSILLASAVYERQFDALPDGVVRPYEAPRIHAKSLRTFWQGETLVSETVMILPDGRICHAREERRLLDERTLEMMIVLQPEGADPVRVRRVFRLLSR
jgi:hypothetical protein